MVKDMASNHADRNNAEAKATSNYDSIVKIVENNFSADDYENLILGIIGAFKFNPDALETISEVVTAELDDIYSADSEPTNLEKMIGYLTSQKWDTGND